MRKLDLAYSPGSWRVREELGGKRARYFIDCPDGLGLHESDTARDAILAASATLPEV